jgi:hypothetical protein
MMRTIFFMLLLCGFLGHSQSLDFPTETKKDSFPELRPDPRYREDQFYAGISYTLMQSKPGGYSQYSVPVKLVFGLLRDIPLNKRRNYAIAIGAGYSYTNIKHSVVTQQEGGVNNYSIISQVDFEKNKLVLHYVDFPLELRWRTSNDTDHRFWRIYTGFKLSYLFYDKAEYRADANSRVKITNDRNINRLMTGMYVAAGYNTWNFYVYYGFDSIYKGVPINDTVDQLKLRPLNFGLMFYIL